MQPPCKHMYVRAHTYAVIHACKCAHGALRVCIYTWRCAQQLVTQLHVQTNIWTNMCTSKPPSAHIHVCARKYVRAHTYTQSHTCEQPHACTRSMHNMHSHPAALANVHKHMYECTCKPPCIHTHMHMCMCTHVCSHAHMQIFMLSFVHVHTHVEMCATAVHTWPHMQTSAWMNTCVCKPTSAHTRMQSHRRANTPIFALVALRTHTRAPSTPTAGVQHPWVPTCALPRLVTSCQPMGTRGDLMPGCRSCLSCRHL